MTFYRFLGIDPGLRKTGWGIVDGNGQRLCHVAHGLIESSQSEDCLSDRLSQIYDKLEKVIQTYQPQYASIERVFVNMNPHSTLKLSHARGSLMACLGKYKIPLAEYEPNHVKKTLVGSGHASKEQVAYMVKLLLPQGKAEGFDCSDALAVAMCHIQHYRF